MVLSILFTSLFAAVATPCGGDTGTFKLNDIVFPDELEIGVKNWFSISGLFSKEITSGLITAKVYKGPFKLLTQNDQLCEKTECPLSGEQTIKSYIEPPAGTPAMTYKLIVDISDQDGQRAGCFQVPMKLVNSKKLKFKSLKAKKPFFWW